LRFPEILQKRWQQEFSAEELSQLGQAMTAEAPFSFRQTGEIDTEELAAVKAEALPEFDWAPGMRYFSTTASRELFKRELPAAGKVYIQDPAASMAPCMVPLKGNEKVLDMCAAPGGKGLILTERLGEGGKLILADRSAKRQELTWDNFGCRKFECDYDIIVSSAEMLELPESSFDVVLADVPCTNTGVFRHKPDALWRFSEKSLKSTRKLQRAILKRAAQLTVPGGFIIYSTCSIERDENQAQVKFLISETRGLSLERERLLLPGKFHDGAYAALIAKN
jgi:16S rRNA (cytosine967-C5)-methyltransferase